MSTIQYAKDQPAGFKNRIEKVAIVGAGGWLGKHITQALLATGKHTVTALTRANSSHTIAEGVTKAVVDYDKPETLVAALRGQDFLVITLNVRAPPTTSATLLKAAAEAGIRYVMPNLHGPNGRDRQLREAMGFGAAYDSTTTLCQELGLQPIVVSPGFWYEFSLAGGIERYGFDLANRKFVVFDDGTVPIHTSTWPHNGAAVAAVLSLPVLPADAAAAAADPVQLTVSRFALPNAAPVASFTVTQHDMFASVKRVTGTTDADWTISRQSAKARWEAASAVLAGTGTTNVDGAPLPFMQAFAQRMYSCVFFDGGDGLTEADLLDGALGLPKEDLDEWTAVAVDYVKNNTLGAYGSD